MFDRWDLIIMIDISIFLSTILTLVIFTTLNVNDNLKSDIKNLDKNVPGENQNLERKEKVDFMEDQIEDKKRIIFSNSIAICTTFYLIFVMEDDS